MATPQAQGLAPQHPPHRLAEALGAGDVLHIYKRVRKEALEGDAFRGVPLQKLSQEISAFRGERGPAGKLGGDRG